MVVGVMKHYIVIHHSLTADGKTVNWQAIRRYHVIERGWDDIGYHYGIEKVGDTYEILLGRLPDQHGAHCKELGMNTFGYGICLVGNFDEAPPPAEQVDIAVGLVRYLMRQDAISVDHVLGHGEVQKLAGYDQVKSCPGKLFDMNKFRSYL